MTYEHDVMIAGDRVDERKTKASKPHRGSFGHTPLSFEEDIPWGLSAPGGGNRCERALFP